MCRMQYAALFAVSFCFVGLKAYQQISVATGRYYHIVPTSLAMAWFELYVVVSMVREPSFWTVIPVGLGSGCGCLVAMWIHERLRK